MVTQFMRDMAYLSGLHARNAGKPDTACPHNDSLAHDWLAGWRWQDARIKFQQEESAP
jgi:ribosome modulation factor